jgi:hypothetical protein
MYVCGYTVYGIKNKSLYDLMLYECRKIFLFTFFFLK